MDILDILIAKSLSFTSETEKLVQQAQQAMADANTVIDNVSAIEDEATAASELAQAASAELDDILADIDAAVETKLTPVETAISSLENRTDTIEETYSKVGLDTVSTETYNGIQITNTIDDTTASEIVKFYTNLGVNTDGGITQAALSTIINGLDDRVTTLEEEGGGGGSVPTFDPDDAGKIPYINDDGHLDAAPIQTDDLIDLLITTNTLSGPDLFGIIIDYPNKTVTRYTGSGTISDENPGAYLFTGRKRCLMDADGSIIKWDPTGADQTTYSTYDVMVYQPAFYYRRVPLELAAGSTGNYITKELLLLTTNPNYGFNIHPAFIDINGKQIPYVLFGAYTASVFSNSSNSFVIYDDPRNGYTSADKLASHYQAVPASNVNGDFTLEDAETMANNKSIYASILTPEIVSMNEMLMMVEYATLNMQAAIDNGVTTQSSSSTINMAVLSGSTASLINATGTAVSYSPKMPSAMLTSVSYRGMENPYGNIWEMITGLAVDNYIYKLYDHAIAFTAPTSNGWIAGFGYDPNYDWLFLPGIVGGTANSNAPVGDYYNISNANNMILTSGASYSDQGAGIFDIGADRSFTYQSAAIGTRLTYTPRREDAQTQYNAWCALVGITPTFYD